MPKLPLVGDELAGCRLRGVPGTGGSTRTVRTLRLDK